MWGFHRRKKKEDREVMQWKPGFLEMLVPKHKHTQTHEHTHTHMSAHTHRHTDTHK